MVIEIFVCCFFNYLLLSGFCLSLSCRSTLHHRLLYNYFGLLGVGYNLNLVDSDLGRNLNAIRDDVLDS